jgi:hypothetical protein
MTQTVSRWPFHVRDQGSRPGQSMWELSWIEVASEHVFLRVLRVVLSIIASSGG